MTAAAHLLLPPKALASFVSAAIYRDTRNTELNDADRMNFFPATPLVAVTCVLHGSLHMGHGLHGVDALKHAPALPPISVRPPNNLPTVSWSPGPVTALTLAIYPDAWRQLTTPKDPHAIPDLFRLPLEKFDPNTPIESAFAQLMQSLVPVWQDAREKTALDLWPGSDKIADWTRHMVTKSLLSPRGRSSRSMERAIRRLTGQSRNTLEYYAKIEQLHRLRQSEPNDTLADIAHAANFADQSHMGRALKRATGFSPAALNRKIAQDEAFWCYRLLGERF